MVPVPTVEPLTAENMLWSNTVLAAGSAVGFVIYTGSETRAVMNTSHPQTKVGLLDLEINRLAKVCKRGLVKQALQRILLDFVCSHFRTFSRPCCSEWVSRSVVCLCLQVFNLIFVHHPDQVCFISHIFVF
jgi:magnesium-transporting ATPase (P-type)